ncbi:hypothetical protein [Zhengella mangrovi]|uniref:hypothetical protein n=1 Tax=Zhengella mangrovi TaxID=1982044 RepID=UPI001055BE6D|nr:hypothetical protein [Zhengella mangrovi]
MNIKKPFPAWPRFSLAFPGAASKTDRLRTRAAAKTGLRRWSAFAANLLQIRLVGIRDEIDANPRTIVNEPVTIQPVEKREGNEPDPCRRDSARPFREGLTAG